MVVIPEKPGFFEVRYVGECPWCGAAVTSMRDYLCHHATNVCCHELYRMLPGKVSIALRSFPRFTVNVEYQFEELVQEFYKCFMKDKRFLKRYEEHVKRIEQRQEEAKGHIIDFFRFLLRLYIIRGQVNVRGMKELLSMQCILCGRNFSDLSRSDMCLDCLHKLGAPSDSFTVEAPAESPKPKKSPGMYSRS